MSYFTKSSIWFFFLLIALLATQQLLSLQPRMAMVALAAVCFFCELLDSTIGMGYGTTLTPLLLVIGYTPSEFVPTILLTQLFGGFTSAFFHDAIENVDFSLKTNHLRSSAILAISGMIGIIVGVKLSLIIPQQPLSLLIGMIITISGAFVLWSCKKNIPYSHLKIVILSTVASFNKAVSGGGYGPLVTSGQILSGTEGKASVAITSFAEGWTCTLAIILYLFTGGYINKTLLLPMLTGTLCAVPCAAFFVSKSPEKTLRMAIGIFTIFFGAVAVAKAMGFITLLGL